MANRVGIRAKPARELLDLLDYSSPVIVFAVFLLLFVAHGIYTAPKIEAPTVTDVLGPGGKPLPRKKKQRSNPVPAFGPKQQALFQWLSVLLVLTFAGDTVLTIAHVIADREEGWWCGKHFVVYVIGSFFSYVLILISLVDSKPSPSIVHGAVWLLTLIMEIMRFGAKVALYTSKHRAGSSRDPRGGPWLKSMTDWEALEVTTEMIRVITIMGLVILYGTLSIVRRRSVKLETSHAESETASLLDGHQVEHGRANGHAYGTTTPIGERPLPSYARPDRAPNKNWWEYLRGYTLFFPYLWPSKSRKLQLYFILCFVCVCAARAVNILVPNQVGDLTNDLTGENGQPPHIPVGGICLYILYKYMQGSNGLLGSIRSALWVPISQYSYQELSVASFEHVHNLSYDFHMSKRTGEVTSALNKGNSINTFLEQVTFNMLPMMADLVLALGYFLYKFDAYYALVVSIMTFVYLYASIRMAMWRSTARREMTNLSREEDAVKNDSMMSWETVKYFNAETYEFSRYRNAVRKFQNQEFIVLMSLTFMNIIQGGVFTLGLMISCFLMAYQISTGQRELGAFTALIIYMAQLQAPLNFFSTFYRQIQYAMINSERLLELFKLQPTVVDQPHATDMVSCDGAIQFNDVKFSYDPRRIALDGVTFRCEPGTTTALVGESGGGKSTIFRLLYRYYNITEGNIQVDDRDLEDVTLDSLRRHIGVVPQDTVLFNESIMYNLKYANQAASDEEIYAACKAASIHDKILSFVDGYDSRVGERGLKLSGGEKQRVAIARTILKNPRVILLDEATAALDTETEGNIQEALSQLSRGRTTIIIAHRLSTITHADQILVLQHGKIVEGGTHRGLLEKNGKYASMWRRQIKAQQAFEEAKILTDRAERLRNQDHSDDSAPQSDDEQPGRPNGYGRRGSHTGTVSSDGDGIRTHADTGGPIQHS